MPNEKQKCEFCGNEYLPMHMKRHLAKCEKNPENLNKEPRPNPTNPEVEAQNIPMPTNSLVIRDVKAITEDIGIVAVFKNGDELSKVPPIFQGILVRDSEEIPVLLVVSSEGMLLPPFMIAGFVSMFPNELEEPKSTEEPLQPEPETIPEPLPLTPTPEPLPDQKESSEERMLKAFANVDRNIVPPGVVEPPKKRSLLDKILRRNK